MEVVKYPLVTVCAGAGYGKTSAVLDFLQEYKAVTVWVHLSECDNVGSRFWENLTHAAMQVNAPFADAMTKLGFPDTPGKIKQYQTIVSEYVMMKQRVIVFDDFHCIKDLSVIKLLEECILHNMPPGTTIFLLSRASVNVNIANFVSMRYIYNISENDLRFTENELAQYLTN